MRWPWRSEENVARDVVREVIDTHRKAALGVIEAAVKSTVTPRGAQDGGQK